MEVPIYIILISLAFLSYVVCSYPPTGDEVLPGSVLLPATRRGRYLANIVRRQAVDGTGIKFNKDADRMNAEAKKKVDVLSDELLPYIIAEQERRTTLYKRIMTAIQNGEKGVTIAEIRNKPPLIIRKGLFYRCPSNRAPKEPDMSGLLMCEDDIEPTQVMYDSCLSAEDKDLYVAENKYFFCNRHRIEGPDLPRNGSTVIGCPPIERTSLNYTNKKCTLEDTDDVVVHYRYYPDRTYKFVTELDPDHEVCDHWNPCQIGYIYSLPSPDTAIPANEIFRPEEIIPPIPEDALEEFVHSAASNYSSSPRRITIPAGYKFEKLWARRLVDNYGWNPQSNQYGVKATVTNDSKAVTADIHFPEKWTDTFYSTYFAVFSKNSRRCMTQQCAAKTVKFLIISPSTVYVNPKTAQVILGQKQNLTRVPFQCTGCLTTGIMVRSIDGHVRNLDSTKYRISERTDPSGQKTNKKFVEIEVAQLAPQDFGDFFMIVQNQDGAEERVKIITIENTAIQLKRVIDSVELGKHFDTSLPFKCSDCELKDVTCNGESTISQGKVAVVPISKLITFNFPRFDDESACVYLGFFKSKSSDKLFSKVLAAIDTVNVKMSTVPAPQIGDQFEHEVPYTCTEECTIDAVIVNGMPLQVNTRRTNPSGSIGFFVFNPTTLYIRITEYTSLYEGIYQAVFNVAGDNVTKTVLEIGDGGSSDGGGGADTETTPVPAGGNDTSSASPDGASTGGGGGTGGEETTAAGGEAPPPDGAPPDAK